MSLSKKNNINAINDEIIHSVLEHDETIFPDSKEATADNAIELSSQLFHTYSKQSRLIKTKIEHVLWHIKNKK